MPGDMLQRALPQTAPACSTEAVLAETAVAIPFAGGGAAAYQNL